MISPPNSAGCSQQQITKGKPERRPETEPTAWREHGLTPPPSLPANEIHVWSYHRLDGQTWMDVLDASERRKAAAFRYAELRARYRAFHAALRFLLAAYLDTDAAGLQFNRGTRGKPVLATPSGTGLHFNLAHSHDHCLVAVSRLAEVGADVERVRPLSDLAALAGRVFTPGEQSALRASGEDTDTFYRLWTRKEAALKALGMGLSLAPDSVGIEAAACGRALVRVGGQDAETWVLRDVRTPEGAVGAVACAAEPAGVAVRTYRIVGPPLVGEVC